MPKKFLDKDGKFLGLDLGNPDPSFYAKAKGFKEGWKVVEVPLEEVHTYFGDDSRRAIPQKPKFDLLLEVLEKRLQLSPGTLSTDITAAGAKK